MSVEQGAFEPEEIIREFGAYSLDLEKRINSIKSEHPELDLKQIHELIWQEDTQDFDRPWN